MAHDIRRLLEAATALSVLLRCAEVPHAFYGGFMAALLMDAPQCDEMFCIVEGGNSHPFRRVRQACVGCEDFIIRSSPWTNRLHATYTRLIPSVDIEILSAGEDGPRHIDESTVMTLTGLPVLTISEFIRAKLKTWIIRRSDHDAEDIQNALSRHWNSVDINRIPEQDMRDFIKCHRAAAAPWTEIRRKYAMR